MAIYWFGSNHSFLALEILFPFFVNVLIWVAAGPSWSPVHWKLPDRSSSSLLLFVLPPVQLSRWGETNLHISVNVTGWSCLLSQIFNIPLWHWNSFFVFIFIPLSVAFKQTLPNFSSKFWLMFPLSRCFYCNAGFMAVPLFFVRGMKRQSSPRKFALLCRSLFLSLKAPLSPAHHLFFFMQIEFYYSANKVSELPAMFLNTKV